MWQQSPQNIYVAGHRGYPDLYPENTLISFQGAIDVGVDMVELDIHMTKDEQLVVIHDESVDRTTNGTGLVRDQTLAQLKALDGGIYKGEQFAGTSLPTFEESLEAMKPYENLLFNFELKEYPKDGNQERAFQAADHALALIEAYGMGDRCIINAFDATLLQYVHDNYHGRYKLHGYYPKAYLHVTAEDRDPYEYIYCACPFTKPRSAECYNWLWEKNIQPWAGAWVSDEAQVREAVSYKTPLITCNNPEMVLAVLKQMGLHS